MRLEFRVWDGLDFVCDSCGEQGPVADVYTVESWRSICAYCYDEEANDAKYDAEQIAERAEL